MLTVSWLDAGSLSFIPIEDALQEETAMLDRVASGRSRYECLLWRTGTCLVAPRSMTSFDQFDVACHTSGEAGWPVHLRTTGGDVTPQGAGVINVSIAYVSPDNSEPSIEAAYERLCSPILQALAEVNIKGDYGHVDGAFCDGAYNIMIGGKKFAGTAQRWRKVHRGIERFAIFSHALLLIETPSAEAIDVINGFYSHCGIDREIRKEAHTGLLDPPLHRKPVDYTSFLSDLRARYDNSLMCLDRT